MAKLYVVATPIGNLSELSPRAIDALRQADLILAEDTRVTIKLLNHLDIHVPLRSNHRHNERAQAQALAARIAEEDLTVALVSDAGTPGVSDPGAVLVQEAVQLSIDVLPIAGPSAVAAALSIAGFEGAGYAFHGFLPREEGARTQALRRIAAETQRICVVFESPHRVAKLVSSIAQTLPQARLCLCCDLTKKYELTLRGAPDVVLAALLANPKSAKGEYVLVIDLSACVIIDETPPLSPRAFLLDAMMEGATLQEARATAMDCGLPRNEVYRAALDVKAWLESQRP